MLAWAVAQPEVELFNSRGKLNESILVPIGPAALKDVLSTNAYDFVKPQGLRFYLACLLGWGLITTEGAHHRAQRRALTPAFNIRHIRNLYTLMWEKVGELVECLQREVTDAEPNTRPLDIVPWASAFALDIIGRAALSRDFNALDAKTNHPVATSFQKMTEPNHKQMSYLLRLFVFPGWLVNWTDPRAGAVLRQERAFMVKTAEELIAAEKQKPAQQETILRSIIHDASLSHSEMVDTVLTIIGAGHETSASSITWACYLLGHPENRKYQEELRKEIQANFPRPGEMMDPAALQHALESSPWLHGVCEEVLRLYPTVPMTLRESIRQTTINGAVIPEGTLIMIVPWAINRNPKFWGAEAACFRPERWMDAVPAAETGSTTPAGAGPRYRLNKHGGAVSNFCETTFLHGARSCIGRDFAKAELKVALAGIFGAFDVTIGEKAQQKLRISGQVTIKPEGGLPVQLVPLVA